MQLPQPAVPLLLSPSTGAERSRRYRQRHTTRDDRNGEDRDERDADRHGWRDGATVMPKLVA